MAHGCANHLTVGSTIWRTGTTARCADGTKAWAAMALRKPCILLMENDKRKPSYAGGKVEVATQQWPADLRAYFSEMGRFVAWGGEPFEWSTSHQDAVLKTVVERCAAVEAVVPAADGATAHVSWDTALATLLYGQTNAADQRISPVGSTAESMPGFLLDLLEEQGLQPADWPPPMPDGCDHHLFGVFYFHRTS